jgi:DNA repair exonuclease SbcCD ATPase subunit
MALDDLELNVGGQSFKGVYVAVVVSFASTIAGGIWTTSEFFSRLEAQEAAVEASEATSATLQARFEDLRQSQTEALQDYQVTIANMQQSLDDNDVASLQGKLAELGTNLGAIMEAQKELLDLRDRVATVEKINSETVLKVDNRLESLKDTNERLKRIQKEIDDLWLGLDSIANPLG